MLEKLLSIIAIKIMEKEMFVYSYYVHLLDLKDLNNILWDDVNLTA